jgi:amino acid transporter
MGALSGMQIAGFHWSNIENPSRVFPKMMGISILIIVVLSLGAILSMSAVIPPSELDVMAGVIQMYQVFFHSVGWDWILGIFVILLSLGLMSSMSAWMLGPARGLQFAAEKGHLPRWFSRLNRRQVPKNILMLQSIVASIIALLFLVMPSFKEVFWMLVALMGQFTVLMYVLIFVSLFVLKCRRKFSSTVIPGGFWGTFAVVGLGSVSCIVAFIVGVVPPAQLGLESTSSFIERMILIDGFILALPFAKDLCLFLTSRN